FFASAMPSGSKARTVAPASDKAGRNARLGLSRISSVFGLKVRPSAAKVSPSTLPPQASTTRRAMLRFRASLTRNTVSTIASGADGFAEIGHLVDEGNLCREKGVGRVFDQLGGFQRREHDRRLEQIERTVERP